MTDRGNSGRDLKRHQPRMLFSCPVSIRFKCIMGISVNMCLGTIQIFCQTLSEAWLGSNRHPFINYDQKKEGEQQIFQIFGTSNETNLPGMNFIATRQGSMQAKADTSNLYYWNSGTLILINTISSSKYFYHSGLTVSSVPRRNIVKRIFTYFITAHYSTVNNVNLF